MATCYLTFDRFLSAFVHQGEPGGIHGSSPVGWALRAVRLRAHTTLDAKCACRRRMSDAVACATCPAFRVSAVVPHDGEYACKDTAATTLLIHFVHIVSLLAQHGEEFL